MPLFLIKYGKHIAIVLVTLAIVASVFFAGRTSGLNEGEVKLQKEVITHQQEIIKLKDENAKNLKETLDKYASASDKFEENLKNLKTREKIIENTVIKEVEKPVYNQCLVPESGVKTLNDAAKTLNDTRK